MRQTAPVLVLLAAAASASAQTTGDVAAEVERGIKAYNSQDLKYYEAALAPDAVYIADDGATFPGKERVLRLFGRLFAGTPAPQLAATDVVTGTRGEVAWARFKWTLTRGDQSRKGVATTLLVKAGAGWQVVSIQNTPDGHAMAGSHR